MVKSLAHNKWMGKYRVVFTPKCSRKIVFARYKVSIVKIIRELYKWKGLEIIEGTAMVDPIHLLVSIPPKYDVSTKGWRAP